MSKADVYESMRADGMTYQEIAKACGCSYQNVSQTLARFKKSQFRPIGKSRCCWDGLRKWMNENRVSNAELIRRKFGRNHTGTEAEKLRLQLRGKRPLKKDDIDFLRGLTGLSYEQLFCSQEDGDE